MFRRLQLLCLILFASLIWVLVPLREYVHHPDEEPQSIPKDPFLAYAINPHSSHAFLKIPWQRPADRSRGIIIPVGKPQITFAVHVIACIRYVHNSSIPIVIAYAGFNDLSKAAQNYLVSIAYNVKLLNIFDYIDDTFVHMKRFTIKPFALLLSPFQHAMLIDADVAFIQTPEALFEDPGYLRTGTFFFHDRLVLKDVASKRFRDRQAWYHELLDNQYHTPSAQLLKSKVWAEKFAEEQDSGVVMINFGHENTAKAVLFAAWMHTIPNAKLLHRKTYGTQVHYDRAHTIL
jgi:alpha 1,3-mannosyltransferase